MPEKLSSLKFEVKLEHLSIPRQVPQDGSLGARVLAGIPAVRASNESRREDLLRYANYVT